MKLPINPQHILITLLVLFILAVGLMLQNSVSLSEGFETVPLSVDPSTKKILYGYYQVDASNMAVIPYGYVIDPSDPTKILANTMSAKIASGTAILDASKNLTATVPAAGKPIPDGFYKLNDASLAVLPPNMKPDVKSIDFTSATPSTLLIYYNNSYVSDNVYYAKKYKPTTYPSALPAGVYYVDPSNIFVSFLQFGKIADSKKGYGMIPDPALNLSATQANFLTSNYRDVSDNYNVQFHDSVETIQKTNGLYDLSFGEVRVMDQCGNMIILPKTKSQGNVTYYQPGEFPFGAASYVPNYEDSMYLSQIKYETARYKSTLLPSYPKKQNHYFDDSTPLHYSEFKKDKK
jgi:hypothetical protein